ncbi:hypothetical protein [Paraburkholderia youngii]|uniref:hypothetical protein n=1 Tax=Paraburkholderia youngii TaxID=2782701 RepID=UPI003D1ACC6F
MTRAKNNAVALEHLRPTFGRHHIVAAIAILDDRVAEDFGAAIRKSLETWLVRREQIELRARQKRREHTVNLDALIGLNVAVIAIQIRRIVAASVSNEQHLFAVY